MTTEEINAGHTTRRAERFALARLRLAGEIADYLGHPWPVCDRYTPDQLADLVSRPKAFVSDLTLLARWALARMDTDPENPAP